MFGFASFVCCLSSVEFMLCWLVSSLIGCVQYFGFGVQWAAACFVRCSWLWMGMWRSFVRSVREFIVHAFAAVFSLADWLLPGVPGEGAENGGV